jgi:lipopolysaccharide export system protein LptA
MTLNMQNQPQSAMMSGGVKYVANEALRQAEGTAAEEHLEFDQKGRPARAVMTGAVHLRERLRASNSATELWNERELNAATVDVTLGTDSRGKTLLHDVKATGDARLKVQNGVVGGTTRSEMAADTLTAHFVRAGDADHIAEVHGDGHTSLRRVNAMGVVNTSAADSLVAHFRTVPADAGRRPGPASKGQVQKKEDFAGNGKDEVADAVEQGHVVVTRLPVRKPGDSAAPAEERAIADRAVYDGDLERTTLTGGAQLSNGTSVLWADRVVTEQQTGDATAEGSVKVSYGQAGGTEEPVHVLAAKADLKHSLQTATFHGTAGTPARLWQGASQVDAPVLQFEQKERRLLAHGEGSGAPMAVHTVLVSAGAPANAPGSSGKPDVARSDAANTGSAASKPGSRGKSGVVRIASRDLVYSDVTRKAEFTGGVEVEGKDGNMRSQQVDVYLQMPPKTNKDGAKPAAVSGVSQSFMGGSVERMVATGNIEMLQPGRRATGDQLSYTAGDGMFVLTGTRAALPKVIDDQRGTVTGTSLRFHSGDDNILVSNGGDSDAGQRVRTETRVKNRQ